MNAQPIQFTSPVADPLRVLAYEGAKNLQKDSDLWRALVEEYGLNLVAASCRTLAESGLPLWFDAVSGQVRRAAATKASNVQQRPVRQSTEAIVALMGSTDGVRKQAADALRKMATDAGMYSVNFRTGEKSAPDNFTVATWAAKDSAIVARLRAKEFI